MLKCNQEDDFLHNLHPLLLVYDAGVWKMNVLMNFCCESKMVLNAKKNKKNFGIQRWDL